MSLLLGGGGCMLPADRSWPWAATPHVNRAPDFQVTQAKLCLFSAVFGVFPKQFCFNVKKHYF